MRKWIAIGLTAATLLGTVAAVIVLKLVVLFPLARAFRLPLADAVRFAFSLAQGGEFAFVLVSFALGLNLLSGEEGALLVAAVAISMAFAPLLIGPKPLPLMYKGVPPASGPLAGTTSLIARTGGT